MTAWPARRQAAVAGVLFVVLLLISAFSTGSPPKFDDPASKVVKYYGDHHRAILITMILSGIALVAFLWFVTQLALILRDVGQGVLAVAVFAGGVATVAVAAIGDAVNAAADQIVDNGGTPGIVRALWQTQLIIFGRFYWTILIVAIALALAAWLGALPRWNAYVCGIACVFLLLGGVSLKSSGAFAAGGVMPLLGFLGFLAFVLSTSIALWMTTAESPRTVTTPA